MKMLAEISPARPNNILRKFMTRARLRIPSTASPQKDKMVLNNGSQQSLKAMTIGDPEAFVPSTEKTPRSTLAQKLLTTIDCVNHLLIGFLTALTLYYSARTLGTLDVHITLCTLGYILLMSEGIIWLAGEDVITGSISRQTRKHVHWILQVLGLVCVIAGVAVMYKVKKFHFRSNHGILGISSLVIMLFLAIWGYPVLIAARLRKLVKPVILKFAHNMLGIVCLVLGMAAQILGFQMRWLPEDIPHARSLAVILTAIVTILTVRSALPKLCSQFSTILSKRQ
ncbi:transmembrane reductase CYB561D2 isoform X1 [Megalopta genalis]|uniref:transmembrane reductase CYB561D2 isoform X1 n=2 Tax=Megalopta genalis TaxID=115081 RepID=UPI003FD148D1